MAKIKKAQNGTVKDSTKTYENSPFQEAKQQIAKSNNNKEIIKKFSDKANQKLVEKLPKKKNGGSLSGLKASNKRVGPVDPKGAFTKVQKKTLAGAKGKASLTKDKQLGATKMKSGGKMAKKK
jgi:hypothetical protein